jgi:hypothetical protein
MVPAMILRMGLNPEWGVELKILKLSVESSAIGPSQGPETNDLLKIKILLKVMNGKLTSVWSSSPWRNFLLAWMLMVEPESMEWTSTPK